MNILLALVPISLLLLLVAIGAFLWAVRRGQFDDLDTPSLDILGDDERPAPAPRRDATRDTPPGDPREATPPRQDD
ncbi:cbb3-type cytochrome oxidase assembly protein CcoS [Arenimonas sp.]|uniref:cbb3-type cytochrome oxidase assembly protein CcoS n=1 Tax=Arenimonas sp. TaxID=1872635 RepID=UPI002E2F18F3|nr:cbb3-type cytochrome oxidase assembly protein CcoS [Arenimonas sp.]HEX4854876.1 cbb3-type cytochrome oxidase assembly protein CcoS [Arenimonas sp.]